MATCPFCEINPQRNDVLHRYEHMYVMLSNPWLVEGHMLAIPNRHVEAPWELTTDEDAQLQLMVKAFQRSIVSLIAPWCDLRQNYRPTLPESDEKVNHLHWHILPRRLYDRLYQECQVHESPIFQSQKFSPQEVASETKKYRRLFGL